MQESRRKQKNLLYLSTANELKGDNCASFLNEVCEFEDFSNKSENVIIILFLGCNQTFFFVFLSLTLVVTKTIDLGKDRLDQTSCVIYLNVDWLDNFLLASKFSLVTWVIHQVRTVVNKCMRIYLQCYPCKVVCTIHFVSSWIGY